jgi:hypothetical protein
MKPILGSTVKKNQGPKDIQKIAESATYEQQYLMQRNIQSILDEQAGVPSSYDYKSFLVYTDNKTGPGFYDPHSKYLDKKSPSATFPSINLSDLKKGKISTEELQFLIMGDGNMARKVTQAKDQIKDYLSKKISVNGKEIEIKGEPALTSRQPTSKQFNTIDVQNSGYRQSDFVSKSVKNSANRGGVFTKKRDSQDRNVKNVSPQPTSNFASGVKRIDWAAKLAGLPGPGAYMPEDETRKLALPVFPTEKR